MHSHFQGPSSSQSVFINLTSAVPRHLAPSWSRTDQNHGEWPPSSSVRAEQHYPDEFMSRSHDVSRSSSVHAPASTSQGYRYNGRISPSTYPPPLSSSSSSTHSPVTAAASRQPVQQQDQTKPQALPIPSRAQVNDYLIRYMKYKDGLDAEWKIDNRRFDMYQLFNAVIQLGGSQRVTDADEWPAVAAIIGLPSYHHPTRGVRTTPDAGRQVGRMFTNVLSNLEGLWDKTKAADIALAAQGREAANSRHLKVTEQYPDNLPTPITASNRHSSNVSSERTASATHMETSSSRQSSSHRTTTQASIPGQQISSNISELLSAPVPTVPHVSPSTQNHALQSTNSTAPPRSDTPDPLILWDPPAIATFEQLVISNALPLPRLGAAVNMPHLSTLASQYAWRAHELRAEIRKMRMNETHRRLGPDELIFWNKLMLLLKKNPAISIPRVPSHPNNSSPVTSNDVLPSIANGISSNGITSLTNGGPITASDKMSGVAVSSKPPNGAAPAKRKNRKKGAITAETADESDAPSQGKPRGRPPKLDANGERVNKPKRTVKRARFEIDGDDAAAHRAEPSSNLVPTSDRPTSNPGETERPLAGSSANGPSVHPGRPSTTIPTVDFLRRLQADRLERPAPESYVGPSAINPALLRLQPTEHRTPPGRESPALPSSQNRPEVEPVPIASTGTVQSKTDPAKSAAAKARWDKWRQLHLDGVTPGTSTCTPGSSLKAIHTPRSSKANSASSSASPRIYLSGDKISIAKMRERDALTPTKIVKSRKKRQPRPSLLAVKSPSPKAEGPFADLAVGISNSQTLGSSAPQADERLDCPSISPTTLFEALSGVGPEDGLDLPGPSGSDLGDVLNGKTVAKAIRAARKSEMIVELPTRDSLKALGNGTHIANTGLPTIDRKDKGKQLSTPNSVVRRSGAHASPRTSEVDRLRMEKSASLPLRLRSTTPRTRSSILRRHGGAGMKRSPLGTSLLTLKVLAVAGIRHRGPPQLRPSTPSRQPRSSLKRVPASSSSVVVLGTSKSVDRGPKLPLGPIDRAKVVIPISRRRRSALIRCGVYGERSSIY